MAGELLVYSGLTSYVDRKEFSLPHWIATFRCFVFHYWGFFELFEDLLAHAAALHLCGKSTKTRSIEVLLNASFAAVRVQRDHRVFLSGWPCFAVGPGRVVDFDGLFVPFSLMLFYAVGTQYLWGIHFWIILPGYQNSLDN